MVESNKQPRDKFGRFLPKQPRDVNTEQQIAPGRDARGRFIPKAAPQRLSPGDERKPFLKGEGNRYAIVCEVKYKQNGRTVTKHISVVQSEITLSKGTKQAVRNQAGMDYDARNVKVKPIQTIDRLYGTRVDPKTGKPWTG